MFEQDVSATLIRKRNPLLRVSFQPADRPWQSQDGFLQQSRDVVSDPRDGRQRSMRSIATSVVGVEFSKSEQFVTYPDGSIQEEDVYWDKALQVYYWQCQSDGQWYFEDPWKDDVITQAGSYETLLKQLEARQFWWLDRDEDVVISKNPDGSKCYAYKGLNNPAQITALLEEEAEQARIAAEQPVSRWKAVALSAMTLLGNAGGFQSLAKSYVQATAPQYSEPRAVDTPTDTSSEYPSAPTESTPVSVQYPLGEAAYQPRAIAKAVQFFSVMATGVASMMHPRLGQARSILPLKLLTLLRGVQSAEGHMLVEAPEASSSAQPSVDSAPDTFTHLFSIPTFSDAPLPNAKPVSNPHLKQAPELSMPHLATVAPHAPEAPSAPQRAAASKERKAPSAVGPLSLDIPVVHFPGPMQVQANPLQSMMEPAAQKPAQLLFSKPLSSLQSAAVSSTPIPAELKVLSDVITMLDNTSKEVEHCTRAVEDAVIVQDESSAQEKAHALQVLTNLRLALSSTRASLEKLENTPNQTMDVDMQETKMIEDALAEARAYFSTHPTVSGLHVLDGSHDRAAMGDSFLSTVSAAMAGIDSKTLGIIMGVLGAGSVAAYMMMTGNERPISQQRYTPGDNFEQLIKDQQLHPEVKDKVDIAIKQFLNSGRQDTIKKISDVAKKAYEIFLEKLFKENPDPKISEEYSLELDSAEYFCLPEDKKNTLKERVALTIKPYEFVYSAPPPTGTRQVYLEVLGDPRDLKIKFSCFNHFGEKRETTFPWDIFSDLLQKSQPIAKTPNRINTRKDSVESKGKKPQTEDKVIATIKKGLPKVKDEILDELLEKVGFQRIVIQKNEIETALAVEGEEIKTIIDTCVSYCIAGQVDNIIKYVNLDKESTQKIRDLLYDTKSSHFDNNCDRTLKELFLVAKPDAKNKLKEMRALVYREIPTKEELSSFVESDTNRMYVPQDYIGYYRYSTSSTATDEIEYLATHGAGPCIILSIAGLTRNGIRLTFLAHLDGSHNSQDKLKSYLDGVLEMTQDIETSALEVSIFASSQSHVSPCVAFAGTEPSQGEYFTDKKCALQDEVYRALRAASLTNIRAYESSQSVIHVIISVQDGTVYAYDGNESSLESLAYEKKKFGAALNIKGDGELFFLKDRGGLCKIEKNAFDLVPSPVGIFYYCYPEQAPLFDETICKREDEIPLKNNKDDFSDFMSNHILRDCSSDRYRP